MDLLPLITNAINNKSYQADFDITNSWHWNYIESLAQILYENANNIGDINNVEDVVIEDQVKYPMMIQIAVKVAKSKKLLSQIRKKIHISIIFAVYKEHERILTKEENELGENFLIRKILQMRFLTDEFENICWDMFIVDDGCPEGSGKIAQKILKEKSYVFDESIPLTKEEYRPEYVCKDNVKVLFLEEAIKQNHDYTKPLENSNQSRKGGSIEYGMHQAALQNKENHIIIFTDADLSTHLGQSGLLVNEIINNGKKSAIGSRREKKSAVVKKGTRNVRGKLFIYLWKRLILPINYIVDTQCGFKAFDARIVDDIIKNTIEKQFAFDIELLLKTELHTKSSIEKVPIAWFDSEAASTTTDLQPYLPMLKSISAMYKKYIVASKESDKFAEFIDRLTERDWLKLIESTPDEIRQKEPATFDTYNEIKVGDLQRLIDDYYWNKEFGLL